MLLPAVPGVLVTAGVGGGALRLLLDPPTAGGLLRGSPVAATPPVAVIAVVGRPGLQARIGIGSGRVGDAGDG